MTDVVIRWDDRVITATGGEDDADVVVSIDPRLPVVVVVEPEPEPDVVVVLEPPADPITIVVEPEPDLDVVVSLDSNPIPIVIEVGSTVPLYVAPGDTYEVKTNSQPLFHRPIKVHLGASIRIDPDGVLVHV